MAIEDRTLVTPGARVSATYKKAAFNGAVLADGRIDIEGLVGSPFASLSAAGRAITGSACNGWRFFSLADGQPTAPTVLTDESAVSRGTRKPRRATKASPQVHRARNQDGVDKGFTRAWCSACMDGFIVEGKAIPETCPNGHARDAADDLAPVGIDTEESAA